MSQKGPVVLKELALFRKIKGDDTAAFKTLFLRYYQKLYAFILAIHSDADLAEETVQEVFVRLWEKRKTTDIHTSVQYYLYRSCKNTAYNLLREKKAKETLPLDEAEEPAEYADPEALLSFRNLQTDFGEAVNDLPEKARKVFMLRYYHGTLHKDIARSLNISESMVEKHWANALRHLRKKLAAHFFQ